MSSDSPTRPPPRTRAARGRPKDQDKRDAILTAAKHLFPLLGLAGASMDDIAAEAGVSKLTLYSHFSNKEELFRQTVMAKCSDHWPEGLFDVQSRQPLRSRLRLIGGGYLDLVFSDNVMSLFRMMAADAGRESPLGKLFWEAGPERTLQRFVQILDDAAAKGEIQITDSRRAAAHFFVLLKGEHHLRVMVGAGGGPSPESRARHVDEVVELFLKAYAAGAPNRG